MFEQQSGTRWKIWGHPQTAAAIPPGWQQARPGPHTDAPTTSFTCHVTGDDPRGCRAGLTGFEVATRKLSGLSSVCWVRLVESAFISVSVGSAWFYLTFSQEHHVIADMLLAFCTRSRNPSNKAVDKNKINKCLRHSPTVANVADFQGFKDNNLLTWRLDWIS